MHDKAIAPASKRPRIIDVDVEQELRDKIRRQDEVIFRLKVFGEQTKVMEEVKRKMEEEKKTMEGGKKNFEEAKKNMEEEKKIMEEEKKNMEEQKKAMEEEKKLAERMEGELRGLIECPVCLNVPRGTRPIPVCSNGHIVCHPCKDRIRQDTLLAKCPSCMVDLGNATSLIALRLVEKVRHECENDGCGSEDECSSYLTSVAIRKPGQDQSSQIFTKLVSQPRPIDLQNWGDVELNHRRERLL